MTIIEKASSAASLANIKDYQNTYESFTWQKAESLLTGLPDGGLNIAYEAIDRHVEKLGRGDKLAIRFLSKTGGERDFSYRDLYQQTNKFANGLKKLGVSKGDSFFALIGRVPELYIGVLGALKHGCVFSPLFSAFGPEPIQARMEIGKGKVLITSEALYKRKVKKIVDQLPDLEYIIIADAKDPDIRADKRVISYADLMEKTEQSYTIAPTKASDRALLHFTSGTTGKPKGAIHIHKAVIAHHITGRYALDLHEDDVFWCTADPGWVTGTSYGIISPLSNGVTMIIDEGEFDAERWYQILQDQKVNVWYTAPTAIRMMMKIGEDALKKFDTSSLRLIASVGEPLNPEAIKWGLSAFHLPIHDNWWQTETGGIMMANYLSMDIKPGSMGKPLPGIQAKILKQKEAGWVETREYEEGQLALKSGWPSMFQGYLNQEERYKKCFTDDGWYLSGDLARKDSDGYFWFVGRADDVIKSSGHLIGPFEVESALIEHPAVAEAAVIGIPDELLGEKVKAFVTLNPSSEPSESLEREIVGFARKKLGPAVAPREIVIADSLPKTRSGKIMRRLLKARELGLPEGDTSTLEADPTTQKKKEERSC